MNGFMVALSCVTAVMFLIYLPFRLVYLAREWRINQKYRLFAVRDELVRLRIEGAFDADMDLYDYYCGVCNALIEHTKELNLRFFTAALQRLTPQESARIDEQVRRINAASPEVRKTIARLYDASMSILRENTTILRFLLRIKASSEILMRVGNALRPLGSSRLLAVKEYGEIAAAQSRLGLQGVQ